MIIVQFLNVFVNLGIRELYHEESSNVSSIDPTIKLLTINVSSIDPPIKDLHALSTMIPFKTLCGNNEQDISWKICLSLY